MSRALLEPDFLARLERLALVARKTFRGAGHGERRAARSGASTEFRDHRLYSPGDDLRHLDWTLLARFDRLYLKRFHDQQDITLHVVLDCSASMGFGKPSKLEAAAKVLAALAHVALADQDRVVLHALAGSAPGSSERLVGRRGTRALLHALSALEAGGSLDLEAALADVARRLQPPGIVIVASDFFSPGASRGLERLAAGRHQLHALRILAPEEREPQVEGDLRLVDSETGGDVVVSISPRVRQLYVEWLGESDRELSAAARRLGATLTAVSSEDAVEHVIFRTLQRQGVLE